MFRECTCACARSMLAVWGVLVCVGCALSRPGSARCAGSARRSADVHEPATSASGVFSERACVLACSGSWRELNISLVECALQAAQELACIHASSLDMLDTDNGNCRSVVQASPALGVISQQACSKLLAQINAG